MVSSLISAKGHPAKIITRWLQGEFALLVSQPIIDEILRVTAYERIQKKYSRVKENRLEFVALVAEQGVWVEPRETLRETFPVITDDESDNRYIECAVSGQAQYIVSGDGHLLELGSYQGIVIAPPAAFIALLEMGRA